MTVTPAVSRATMPVTIHSRTSSGATAAPETASM